MSTEPLLLNKKEGDTPLQALDQHRTTHAIADDVPLTYIGRLDPMASGLLLVLQGDDVHQRDAYLKLDKVYEASFLIGITTDSYDILGLAAKGNDRVIEPAAIQTYIEELTGESTYTLPPYSSYKINGKPLWTYARAGTLDTIEIPKRTSTIYEVKGAGVEGSVKLQTIPSTQLLTDIKERISKVQGDFRQQECITSWQNALQDKNEFQILNLTIHCSSGTYIRSIAHMLGQHFGTGACLYRLKRTKIGKFELQ